jgi:hypothetical protein
MSQRVGNILCEIHVFPKFICISGSGGLLHISPLDFDILGIYPHIIVLHIALLDVICNLLSIC